MQITVYTHPNCQQSKATVTFMNRMGLVYRIIDVTEEAEAPAELANIEHGWLPVVVAEHNGHKSVWWGFRPGMIQQLAQFAG